MNKKEFEEKFGRRIHLSFECSDAERLFIDIWLWIEEYTKQARIDEINREDLGDVCDWNYEFQIYKKNRIEELNK